MSEESRRQKREREGGREVVKRQENRCTDLQMVRRQSAAAFRHILLYWGQGVDMAPKRSERSP